MKIMVVKDSHLWFNILTCKPYQGVNKDQGKAETLENHLEQYHNSQYPRVRPTEIWFMWFTHEDLQPLRAQSWWRVYDVIPQYFSSNTQEAKKFPTLYGSKVTTYSRLISFKSNKMCWNVNSNSFPTAERTKSQCTQRSARRLRPIFGAQRLIIRVSAQVHLHWWINGIETTSSERKRNPHPDVQ